MLHNLGLIATKKFVRKNEIFSLLADNFSSMHAPIMLGSQLHTAYATSQLYRRDKRHNMHNTFISCWRRHCASSQLAIMGGGNESLCTAEIWTSWLKMLFFVVETHLLLVGVSASFCLSTRSCVTRKEWAPESVVPPSCLVIPCRLSL